MWKCQQLAAWTALMALAMVCFARSDDAKPTDEGKAAAFKGKTVEMADKAQFAITLDVTAGQEVVATTSGTKETDVHLFVYDAGNKELGKDTSPGPKCEVKFTPAKDGKVKFVVHNSGGTNKVTLEVKVAK